jgi:sulfate transport system permease protein
MAGSATSLARRGRSLRTSRRGLSDPAWARYLLTGIAVVFMALFLVVPLAAVFAEAFRKGAAAYFASFNDPDAWSAIKLTLLVAAICVPLNTIFGVAAAWAIGKYPFPGRSVVLTLVDLPFAVSPVIAGLIYVLVFGARGWLGQLEDHYAWFGSWMYHHNIQIIFAVPGIVLATLFVSFPFVARELIPLMESQGNDEEYAALTLGASGWQTFWRVTLPNVKWGLFYGVILCNARTMGEFGAVSVVSGHIQGATNTLPLYVEYLYNDYDFTGAFACSSLLVLLALITLCLKTFIEWRHGRTHGNGAH